MAWRGHKGDPGMEASGIRRVSLLDCRVLVHLMKTVTPVDSEVTGGLKSLACEGQKIGNPEEPVIS